MGALWPETTKFLGMFSLKTGFYCYIVFHLILNGYSLHTCWRLLNYTFFTSSLDTEESFNDTNIENLYPIRSMANGLTIAVTVYISVQVISVIFLLVGYCKSRPVFVKYYVYYSIMIWIFQFFIGYIITLWLQVPSRIILLLITLIHAYMLLVLRTFYLQIIGKSRLAVSSSDSESRCSTVVSCTEQSVSENLRDTSHHCRTCTCDQSTATTHETTTCQVFNSDTATSSVEPSSDGCSELEIKAAENNVSKTVNFKEEHVIYDEEQLTRFRTDLGDGSSTSNMNRSLNDRLTINQ